MKIMIIIIINSVVVAVPWSDVVTHSDNCPTTSITSLFEPQDSICLTHVRSSQSLIRRRLAKNVVSGSFVFARANTLLGHRINIEHIRRSSYSDAKA
jgi:hypothetical protein